MTSPNETKPAVAPSGLNVGLGTLGTICATRIENKTPIAYRLCSKSGNLILQGAYQWQEGWDKGGIEWRDIPTVELHDDA